MLWRDNFLVFHADDRQTLDLGTGSRIAGTEQYTLYCAVSARRRPAAGADGRGPGASPWRSPRAPIEQDARPRRGRRREASSVRPHRGPNVDVLSFCSKGNKRMITWHYPYFTHLLRAVLMES